jgi:hypothetical protein
VLIKYVDSDGQGGYIETGAIIKIQGRDPRDYDDPADHVMTYIYILDHSVQVRLAVNSVYEKLMAGEELVSLPASPRRPARPRSSAQNLQELSPDRSNAAFYHPIEVPLGTTAPTNPISGAEISSTPTR